MKEENNIDKYFKSQLEGGEAEVPDASWNSIKGKINTTSNDVIFYNRNGNNTKALLLCLLFGALISGISFYAYHLQKQNELLVELLDKDEQLIHKEEALYHELLTKNKLAEKANQKNQIQENKANASKNNHFEKKSKVYQSNQELSGEVNSTYHRKVRQPNLLAFTNLNGLKSKKDNNLDKYVYENEAEPAAHLHNVRDTNPQVQDNSVHLRKLDPISDIIANPSKTELREDKDVVTLNKDDAQRVNDNKNVGLTPSDSLRFKIKNNNFQSNITVNTSSTVGSNDLNVVVAKPSRTELKEEKNDVTLYMDDDKGVNNNKNSDYLGAKEENSTPASNSIENTRSPSGSNNLIEVNDSQMSTDESSNSTSPTFGNKQFDAKDSTNTSLLVQDNASGLAFPTHIMAEEVDSITKKEDSLLIKNTKEKQSNKESKSRKPFRIVNSVELLLAPEVSYRSVSYSNTPLSETARQYKANDKNRFAYSGGVMFTRDISKKLYLQTGILYSNFGDQNNSTFALKNYDTTYTRDVRGGELSTTAATPTPDFSTTSYSKVNGYQSYDSSNITVLTEDWAYNADNKILYKLQIKESVKNVGMHIKNSINYIGLPLVIGTNIGTSKWRFGVFSGVITNVLLSPSSVTAYSYTEKRSSGEEVVSRKIDLNRFNFVYWGGIDLTYSLNENWSLRVAPTMKRFMNSIYKDSDVVKQMPYSYGIQVGLKYNLIQTKK